MPDSSIQNDPPFVDVKVTNPVQYLKIWWNRLIGTEGVDFSMHVKPLTAIAISLAIISVGFGLGRITIPTINLPFIKYSQTPTPTPSSPPDSDWKETGFTGTLQYTSTSNKFFLITTSSSEAITLQVPGNIDLQDLISKRIFASGNYSKSARILIVSDTKDLEVLPKSPVPAPTFTPSPSPSPTNTPAPEQTEPPLKQTQY